MLESRILLNQKPDLFISRGIVGNAALVAALQQSFANQTQFLTNTFQIDQGDNFISNSYFWIFELNQTYLITGGGGETECLTCSLIQMGSSMAYGDNSCPQCGAKCDVWAHVGIITSTNSSKMSWNRW